MEFTLCSEMSVHSGFELEFENVGFWREERPGVPGEKPLVEYQQHTRPTYDAGSWNSVGGGKNGKPAHSPMPHPYSLNIPTPAWFKYWLVLSLGYWLRYVTGFNEFLQTLRRNETYRFGKSGWRDSWTVNRLAKSDANLFYHRWLTNKFNLFYFLSLSETTPSTDLRISLL